MLLKIKQIKPKYKKNKYVFVNCQNSFNHISMAQNCKRASQPPWVEHSIWEICFYDEGLFYLFETIFKFNPRKLAHTL